MKCHIIVLKNFNWWTTLAELSFQMVADAFCILSYQVTPDRKRHRPTVNEQQVLSALVGYINSHSIPSITDVSFTLQPIHGCWINCLVQLLVPTLSDHHCSSLYECCCYSKPSNHWEVPNYTMETRRSSENV